MTKTRTETDTFGPIDVPADRYWGAQAERSRGNFRIGWERQPLPVVRALGIVKRAAAEANMEGGDAAALLVVPVDMPSLTPEILSRLILEWRKSGGGLDGAAFCGHELPVILGVSPKALQTVEDLCKPETATGLRSVRVLLGRLTMLTVAAENIPSHEFLNVNTPGDLAEILPGTL